MKNASAYSPALAVSSVASIFLLAGPATASTIPYVTVFSNDVDGNKILYDSVAGLSEVLNGSATVLSSSSTPSTNVLGLTAASNSLSSSLFFPLSNTTRLSSSSAYANLATGTIGAYAAVNQSGIAQAGAQLQDSLTFNNTSGHTVNIDVYWTFDGLVPVAGPGNGIDVLFCLTANTGCQGAPSQGVHGPGSGGQFFRLQDSPDLGTGVPVPEISEPTTSQWVSATFTPSINADSGTFHGVFTVPTGTSVDSLNAYFQIQCSQGETCDYSHTGTLSFGNLTGTGVSFTSASGVLLSQSAAPEPGTWILMLAGFVLIGLTKRRSSQKESTK